MNFQSGFIAVVGRPNVGKSTLINELIGQKLSITSHKPQTTRHRIHAIDTQTNYQMIFVDTPGIHIGNKKAINSYISLINWLYGISAYNVEQSNIDIDLTLYQELSLCQVDDSHR